VRPSRVGGPSSYQAHVFSRLFLLMFFFDTVSVRGSNERRKRRQTGG